MATLKVEATEYTREDGLKMIKLPTGMWIVRKIDGRTWLYSDSKSKWIIVTTLTILNDMGMPFDRAMELLNTLPELS